jgi:hypothetical protein
LLATTPINVKEFIVKKQNEGIGVASRSGSGIAVSAHEGVGIVISAHEGSSIADGIGGAIGREGLGGA